MLKKLPAAKVQLKAWSDLQAFRAERYEEAAETRRAEFERQSSLLEVQAALETLRSVRGAVSQAIRAKAGEDGVRLLDERAPQPDEISALDEGPPTLDRVWGYEGSKRWVQALEEGAWGATTRGGARRPSHGDLLRLVFPDAQAEYEKAKGLKQDLVRADRFMFSDAEWKSRMNEAAKAMPKWTEDHDLYWFVGQNSRLLKRLHKDLAPNKRLMALSRNTAKSLKTQADKEIRKLDLSEKRERKREDRLQSHHYWAAYELVLDERRAYEVFSAVCFEEYEMEQRDHPLMLGSFDSQAFWWYQDNIYVTEEDLEPDDVQALINEKENKKRSKLNKARDLQAMREEDDDVKPAKSGKGGKKTRKSIPEDVRHAVWRRDEGKCVDCDSQQELEFDHIIPLAMGGSNTERNLQLLCADCNRRKGATLG